MGNRKWLKIRAVAWRKVGAYFFLLAWVRRQGIAAALVSGRFPAIGAAVSGRIAAILSVVTDSPGISGLPSGMVPGKLHEWRRNKGVG